MNKKLVYTIALVIAVTALSGFATEDAATQESILKRLEALEGGNKSSSWAEKVQVKGDVRYRYELKKKNSTASDSRHRVRARVGAYAKVNDNVKAGIRVASGSDDSPTSTNQTIDDYAPERPVWIDLAYITLNCDQVEGLSATFGKMKQPWVQVSDLIFDSDVNPEGISASYDTELGGISLMTRLAYHIMNDKSVGVWEDVALKSAQIAAAADVGEGLKLTTGVGAFLYNNIEGSTPAGISKTTGFPSTGSNTSVGAGAGTSYMYGYDIIDAFAKLDIKNGPAPIKVYGEVLQNVASGVSQDQAWIVGVGTKCPKTGISLEYNYRDLATDSVLDFLDDGDFGGPGGSGHKVKAKYALMKNTTVGATYFHVKNSGNSSGTELDLLQLDLAIKF